MTKLYVEHLGFFFGPPCRLVFTARRRRVSLKSNEDCDRAWNRSQTDGWMSMIIRPTPILQYAIAMALLVRGGATGMATMTGHGHSTFGTAHVLFTQTGNSTMFRHFKTIGLGNCFNRKRIAANALSWTPLDALPPGPTLVSPMSGHSTFRSVPPPLLLNCYEMRSVSS